MKIALVGYGKMGRRIDHLASDMGHEVVARLDRGADIDADALGGAEVAIEFTHPGEVVENVRRILTASPIPIVVGTTGWYDALDELRALVDDHGVGLAYGPNFSIGVHLFTAVLRSAMREAAALEDYDVHLLEEHHRHKADHPSGTARRLADLIVEALPRKSSWRPGPPDGPADPSTLWVTSVRAGEIPGTHVVALEGPDDRIELKHEARGRDGFARGALAAAGWIHGRSGLHRFEQLLAEALNDESRPTEPPETAE